MVKRASIKRRKAEQDVAVPVGPTEGAEPEPSGPEGCYAIRPWTETMVAGSEPDDEFIEEFSGSIVFYRERLERERAGRFRTFQIRLADAWDAGWSPCDVMGAHSKTLYRYCHPLFDPKTGDFHDSLVDDFQILAGKLVVLDCIEILPQHRGRRLGLAVASKLIDLLTATPMALVACCPIPVQFDPTYGDGRRPDPRFVSAMGLGAFTRSVPQAIGKLRRYWSKLGFKRVAKTDVYALSTSLVRPKLQDICDASLF